MIDGASILTYTNCWVYILQKKEETKNPEIAYTISFKDLLRQCRDAELLYYRQFNQMTEAMGHKLLLENLSADSLYVYITQMNPEMTDLSKDFLDM